MKLIRTKAATNNLDHTMEDRTAGVIRADVDAVPGSQSKLVFRRIQKEKQKLLFIFGRLDSDQTQ